MEITKETRVYDGHFKIDSYELKNPDNGEMHSEECFERGNSVAALIYDRTKDKFLFVSQYRIGSKSELLEIVAGSMDKENETPIEALRREIAEEMGLEIVSNDESPGYHEIGSFYVSPGGCSEKVHLFIVDNVVQNGDGGGIGEENISTIELSPEEIFDKIQKGEVTDMKTAFAIQIFFAAQQ